VFFGNAILGHGLSSHLTILAFRFCTTFPLGRVVYVAIHIRDSAVMPIQASSPMISRMFIAFANNDECYDEYDQPEKHPAQQGTECFGYGHGVGGVGHR
jgi:hypothetical protein